MLFSKSRYHSSYFHNVTYQLAGNLYDSRSSLTDYFSLKTENELLRLENEQLRNLIKKSFIKSDADVITFRDSLYREKYKHISANVVNITTTNPKNLITINRGSDKNISEGMGVISSNGLVGHVVRVSKNFSIVKPVINTEFASLVKLKKNNESGTLSWRWGEQSAFVNRVPKHVNVTKGDTVITSPTENSFPESTVIGTVDEVILNSGEAFYNLKLKLATDFEKLKTVYVIEDVFKEEQLELESNIGANE